MSTPAALATAWMRAAGPTRIGTIRPGLRRLQRRPAATAASTGCTTAVGTAVAARGPGERSRAYRS